MEEIRLTAGGGGFTASYYKTLQPPCRAIETYPFWCCEPLPPEGQCYSVKRFTQAYVITTCAFFVSKKSLGLQKNIKTSKKGLTNPQKFEAPPVSKGTTPIVNKEDLL